MYTTLFHINSYLALLMIRFTDSPLGVFPQQVDARHRAVSAIFAPRKLGQLGEVGRLKKEKLGDPEDWRNHGPIFLRENDEKPMGFYGILKGF